jgi:hypothetical protein
MKYLPYGIIVTALLLSTAGQACAKGGGSHEKGERPERPSFASIDFNSDGEVSFEEFSQHEIPGGDYDAFFAQIDSNSDSVISEDEFNSHKPPRRSKK